MLAMLGKLFAKLFSSTPAEPPPPLPMHAEADLRECLRLYDVKLERAQTKAVLEAVRLGRTIEAIKELREGAVPRIGLKESKDIIDAFAVKLKAGPSDRFRR